jgi:DNA-binding NtrC family response regulator
MRTNQHIVIADDEPQILKLYTRLLSRNPYSVTAVPSVEAANEVLERKPVDLLVLDLNMPGRDGFDLLKTLRVTRPGLRILVISGYLQGALLKASELLGATASLSKLDAPAKLLTTVEALLE